MNDIGSVLSQKVAKLIAMISTGGYELPSLPSKAFGLLQYICGDDFAGESLEKLIALIEMNQAVAACLLKIANSPAWGGCESIATVREAVLRLGAVETCKTVLKIEMLEIFKNKNTHLESKIWNESFVAAISGRRLATMCGLNAEVVFTACLLSHIGVLILLDFFGDDYLDVLKKHHFDGQEINALEVDEYGIAHAEIGWMAAEIWNFPEVLKAGIRYHGGTCAVGMAGDSKGASDNQNEKLISVINVAHLIAEFFISENAMLRNKIIEHCHDSLGLATEECEMLLRGVHDDVEHASQLYQIDRLAIAMPQRICRVLTECSFPTSQNIITVVRQSRLYTITPALDIACYDRGGDGLCLPIYQAGRKCFEVFSDRQMCGLCPIKAVLKDTSAMAATAKSLEQLKCGHFACKQFFMSMLPVFIRNDELETVVTVQKAVATEQLCSLEGLAAIGATASGIAHDFNNILTLILGNSGIIRDYIGDDSGRHNLLDRLDSAANQGKHLAAQIMKLSHGRSDDGRQVINLAELVDSMQDMFECISGRRYSFQGDGEACNVLAEPLQLERIMTNLITNASQAISRTGGLIRVKVGVMAKEGNKRYALLEVHDNGAGIDIKAGQEQDIFQPFYTTKENGNGLGLHIVQTIVASLGGFIECESQIGVGTVFRVYIPEHDRI